MELDLEPTNGWQNFGGVLELEERGRQALASKSMSL